MHVNEVNRVLRLEQSCWLVLISERNSTLRAPAKKDFEKEFFKVRSTAIYGKTCENQKKLTEIKISTSEGK